MTFGSHKYAKPFHLPIGATDAPREIVKACQWHIEAAEASRNMPDLSRSPNSKLAVIRRAMEEIIRNRRQLEYLVVENKVLKDLLLAKEQSCPPSTNAHNADSGLKSSPE